MVNLEETPKDMKKVLKVLVVGEMGTGKTSLIRQYVQGCFSEFYKTTIGVDFANKEYQWDSNTSINIQLWDIAGQERYGNMTHVYYQEASAAFVVFDVTRMATLEAVSEWKKDIDSKVFTDEGKPIPCMLLGNKIDLCANGKWSKTQEEMEQYIKDNGFIGFYTTSASNGTNIEQSVSDLVSYVMNNKIEPQREEKGVELTNQNTENKKKGGCCGK
ncbi:Ras family protein [Histomonas meleagridis]|uniref:Ras family protein n=1 Tax=Histomonas meleagridis TaxID=135588 RepID=UPI00355A47E6|nr:Ras family protein [Histomonas meleagridis]KAH0797018.1 Ras family protein [Histomonas meleagridis]